MISLNKIKFITSLKEKKYRELHKLFVIEGEKSIIDILSFNPQRIDQILATEAWLDKYKWHNNLKLIPNVFTCTTKELGKISSFKTTPEVVAILQIAHPELNENELASNLSLILDTVQDPGNMGNIIRTADWFGIRNIICSPNCADCYNPKVVQASMGAIVHVNIYYTVIENFLKIISSVEGYNIYGTFLDGTNVYSADITSTGAIVMGNESQGISKSLLPYINKRIFIPPHNQRTETIDSLNVAAATAIICSEFRRRLS